jgi:regulator of protease activity HflC (stomatin/prohibitin superfamily)
MALAFQIIIAVVISAVWIGGGFKFARAYERFVVLRLGRVAGVRGPGLTFLFQPVEKAFRVDLREAALRLNERTFKTVDGRGVRYSAEISWKVVDPIQSIVRVQSIPYAVSKLAEQWLETATAGARFGEVASRKRDLERELAAHLRGKFQDFGIELCSCRVSDVVPA